MAKAATAAALGDADVSVSSMGLTARGADLKAGFTDAMGAKAEVHAIMAARTTRKKVFMVDKKRGVERGDGTC